MKIPETKTDQEIILTLKVGAERFLLADWKSRPKGRCQGTFQASLRHIAFPKINIILQLLGQAKLQPDRARSRRNVQLGCGTAPGMKKLKSLKTDGENIGFVAVT